MCWVDRLCNVSWVPCLELSTVNYTHVDAGGVERTLVGDAVGAQGVVQGALGQEAGAFLGDGHHDGGGDADGSGGTQQAGQDARH